MNRLTPIGPLLALAAFAAAPAAAVEPSTEEFKLVLTPEPGQSPPARVCFASRNGRMHGARAAMAHLRSLADGAQCEGDVCRVTRGPRPGRCGECPAETHPDCRARIDPGGRPLADYTVVCADDASAPVDGGTLYVAVESVEAENPPELHAIEVAGGRVRWSPVAGTRRPSYQVLGGDFESSRLSYPRTPSDRPWAEMPIRRRCRCLDARLPVGIDAIDGVWIDGAVVCRGAARSGDLLPLEVPATARGRVRGLRIDAPAARLELAWGDRWPTVPFAPTLRRMRFDWRMPCAWPVPERCPAVAVRGARCTTSDPADGVCRYDCAAMAAGALASPVDVTFAHDTPPLRWTAVISAAGEVSTADVPAAERVVRADVRSWQTTVPGDRIAALRVDGADGPPRTLALFDGAGLLWVPAPGARCGRALEVTPQGERDYLTRSAVIEPGGRLALDLPGEQVVPWDAHIAFGTGAGIIGSADDDDAAGLAVEPQLIVTGEAGLRIRPAGRPWFADVRAVGGLVSAWPFGPMGVGGDGRTTRTAPLWLVGAEATAGYSVGLQGNVLHLFAGGGPSMALAVDGDHVDRLPHRALLGSAVVGGQWPLVADVESRAHLRLTLRYVFGGDVRRFGSNFRGPSIERRDRADLFTLSGGVDFGL